MLARGELLRVELDPHRVLLRAVHLHLRHAVDRGEPLGQERLGVLVELRQRQRGATERVVQDRRLADGSTFRKLGGSMSCGSCALGLGDRRLHVLRGGVDVRGSSANCSVIEVLPWLLVDVIASMPGMVENCFSSGVATDEAMVSGLAPGRLALTEIVG